MYDDSHDSETPIDQEKEAETANAQKKRHGYMNKRIHHFSAEECGSQISGSQFRKTQLPAQLRGHREKPVEKSAMERHVNFTLDSVCRPRLEEA